MAKFNIAGLNGLRAISITMVILYHLNIHNYLPQHGIIKEIASLFFDGPLGVNIFFLISGFLITTLLIRETELTGDVSLKNFYYRRIIRIFPAYYFLLLVYFILTRLNYFNIADTDWFSDITYTKQFFKKGSIFETQHLWSLSVEEIFYLIWPAFFIYFKKYSIGVITLVAVICSAVRYFTYQYPVLKFDETIFTSADALLIGCLFALKYDQVVSWVIKNRRLFPVIFFLFAVSVVTYTYLFHLQSTSDIGDVSQVKYKIALSLSYAFLGQIGLLTNLLIGVVVIYSIVSKGLWSKFLNLPLLNFIGKLSYSLYLWQQLFTADRLYLHNLPLTALILIIFMAACLSYYFVERPFLILKYRFDFTKA